MRRKIAPSKAPPVPTLVGHPPRPDGINAAAEELASMVEDAGVVSPGYGLGSPARGEPAWRLYVFADGDVKLPAEVGGFQVVRRPGMKR